MDLFTTEFHILSEAHMQAFAAALGKGLRCGDILLLEGHIGAGKSFFARSLIQSVQDIPEEVPSPTFTLVQTYDTQIGEIWHADLYRLTSHQEVVELGLEEAFETSISLIEWPDRLGDLSRYSPLNIAFSSGASEDDRHLKLQGPASIWAPRLQGLIDE
jgi:tRNA threonylcarbamoyladenosine biosynthesis protein TsaE